MTYLLTADRDSCISRAAAAKLPCCTTLVNALIELSLSIWPLHAPLSLNQGHRRNNCSDCLQIIARRYCVGRAKSIIAMTTPTETIDMPTAKPVPGKTLLTPADHTLVLID